MADPLRAMLRRLGLGRDGSAPLPRGIEEIRQLIGQQDDELAAEQEQMLLGLFHFRDTLAREVMTPRRDIVALPITASLTQTLELITEAGHSRIPVYRDAIDDVVGILLVKDLLAYVTRQPTPPAESFELAALMREPYFVPDTKPIGELLTELRRRSVHIAILLDEFGGTQGLVTLEDMIEEIVGDIYDEHDVPAETPFEVTPDGDIVMDGGASIYEVNDRFDLDLPEADFDTVGGFVFGELGRIPLEGDIVAVPGAGEFHVQAVEGRRILRVRLSRAGRESGVAEAGQPATAQGAVETPAADSAATEPADALPPADPDSADSAAPGRPHRSPGH
jgi:putative hemolysin